MAITTRQTSLLVQQDWTKIYQTFREADFQSFDFETLRKSMIEYLRAYYPEDFNDFTESSEYIALIDLIAFLGQSLAFRTDLNARENFIDTAERRDSILKLAKLISYNPKRNQAASGLLKFDSVTTTEQVFDSNGTNLSNLVINWNDTTNDNWLEQFTAVLNAALVSNQAIGKPGSSQALNGVKTDEYSLRLINNIIPVSAYSATIAGVRYPFEVVSGTTANQNYIYESTPAPDGTFNILYRNDNQGNASNNTGYFFYFKQGELKNLDFTLTDSLPNRVVSINFDNVNNTDVWLYQLDSNGVPTTLWTQVPAVNGVNVIYNSNSVERNLYSINTRANDQIDLIFGDGAFVNIPVGTFRIYYRQSNNLTYKITPDEMTSVPIVINYRGRTGRAETLTIRASLQYTVTNASARETIDSIRTNAPQQYYTQNRMVTGEDYNILPYTTFNNVLKAKAVNRASSGISRYLDVVDATGKYSSTNIFAEDGLIYKENRDTVKVFQFTNSSEVNFIIQNLVKPLISETPSKHLYYDTATRFTPTGTSVSVGNLLVGTAYTISSVGSTDFLALGAIANTIGTKFIATSTGVVTAGNFIIGNSYTIVTVADTNFVAIGASSNSVGVTFTATGVGSGSGTAKQGNGTVNKLGKWTLTSLSNGRSTGTFDSPDYTYITQGALIKFVAPAGKYFDAQNQLQSGTPTTEFQKTTLWASVIAYNTPGSGSAILSVVVPTDAIVDQVIPVFANDWPAALTNTIANNILSYKNFGLRYDIPTKSWAIIDEANLGSGDFSLTNAGNTAGTNLDNSWFIKLTYDNLEYTVQSRGLDYIFQSVLETRFYFDPNVKVYDSKTATTRSDVIKVLRSNTNPDDSNSIYYSQSYKIWNRIVESDGYEDNRRILITFPDDNLDTVPDNPDLFTTLVAPTVNPNNKFVFFESVQDQYNFSKYEPLPENTVVTAYATENSIRDNNILYASGTIFYATAENKFFVSSAGTITQSDQYLARTGRQNLLFQYRHNAPNNRRIDPNPNNLIDLYILTREYSDQYFAYITDTSNRLTEPAAPTNEELKSEFSSIENFKVVSDTLIYNSAVFKPLFGSKAEPALQATFKVVKNPNLNISDNDVKSQVIAAINRYFEIDNWDFGETFYFSELSAYLHSELSPNVSSIIIVPSSSLSSFGSLFQINAEPNEIVVSAATVDNVQIINAITAAQINQQIG